MPVGKFDAEVWVRKKTHSLVDDIAWRSDSMEEALSEVASYLIRLMSK